MVFILIRYSFGKKPGSGKSLLTGDDYPSKIHFSDYVKSLLGFPVWQICRCRLSLYVSSISNEMRPSTRQVSWLKCKIVLLVISRHETRRSDTCKLHFQIVNTKKIGVKLEAFITENNYNINDKTCRKTV